MKKLMYLRSGPYEPDISGYNMQEIGMLTEFCKKGYDCDLFYYGKKTHIEKINIGKNYGKLTIHFIKGIRILRSGIYTKLLSKKFLSNYDIIITSEYSQIMTVLISKLHPNVYCYNGPYYNLFKIPILEKIYDFLFISTLHKNIKKFFCKSVLAEEYLNHKGLIKTVTIGVGQNFSKFEKIKSPMNSTLKLVDVMLKNPVLLVVGSIDDRKNFPFILEVFDQVLKTNSNFRLMIVGQGKKKYIQKQLSKFDNNLKEKIIFVGKLKNTELQFVYSKAYAFLMPSKLEIFGMVLLEAMSFGSVVISSSNGGSATLIEDEENGYVLNIDNKKEWSDLINSKKFKLSRKNIQNNAKKTIKNNFSWQHVVNNLIESCDI